jgi:hypothetical protein
MTERVGISLDKGIKVCDRRFSQTQIAFDVSQLKLVDLGRQGGLLVCRAGASILGHMCGEGAKFSSTVTIPGIYRIFRSMFSY